MFMVKDLEDCTVILLDQSAQITVDRCKNCTFYVGPIKSSIFFRDSSNCTMTVSCSQFRCRDLSDSHILLFTPNDPIIESSSNLTFGPYNLKYPQLKQHAEASQLTGTFIDDDGKKQQKVNKWNLIFDFTKQESGDNNFKIVDVKQWKIVYATSIMDGLQGEENEFIYELPKEFGGQLDSAAQSAARDNMVTFDITTGAAKA